MPGKHRQKEGKVNSTAKKNNPNRLCSSWSRCSLLAIWVEYWICVIYCHKLLETLCCAHISWDLLFGCVVSVGISWKIEKYIYSNVFTCVLNVNFLCTIYITLAFCYGTTVIPVFFGYMYTIIIIPFFLFFTCTCKTIVLLEAAWSTV